PLDNAIAYEKDVAAYFASQGKNLKKPRDAADDGTGTSYQQFSAWNLSSEPDLFMPWSIGFSFLGDPADADPAFRFQLSNNLQGPLGLVDSVTWPNSEALPTRMAARI